MIIGYIKMIRYFKKVDEVFCYMKIWIQFLLEWSYDVGLLIINIHNGIQDGQELYAYC